jgi:sporulation protein YqfC
MLKNVYSGTAIYLQGNTSMVVENCQKVVEYNDIYISLKAKGLKVYVWGKNLRMDSFGVDKVRIVGDIQSVEFSR